MRRPCALGLAPEAEACRGGTPGAQEGLGHLARDQSYNWQLSAHREGVRDETDWLLLRQGTVLLDDPTKKLRPSGAKLDGHGVTESD